jgi:hypothetical protein
LTPITGAVLVLAWFAQLMTIPAGKAGDTFHIWSTRRNGGARHYMFTWRGIRRCRGAKKNSRQSAFIECGRGNDLVVGAGSRFADPMAQDSNAALPNTVSLIIL